MSCLESVFFFFTFVGLITANMKHLTFLLVFTFLASVCLYAQNGKAQALIELSLSQIAENEANEADDVTAPVEGTVYDAVSEMPTMKDGTEFSVWVAEHLKYPAQAKEDGIQGRVTVRFVVTDKGKVRQVKVARGVEESLDKEAVRVISASSGKWNPGTLDGEPVNTRLSIPVIFRF